MQLPPAHQQGGVCDVAGALEQESWSAVPVPTDSQHLINDWVEHAAKVKSASSNPAKRPSALSNGNESPGESHITAILDMYHLMLLAM